MALLGSHLSIAGGYYKAVNAASKLGMDCVQIFTKNNNQWRAKPLVDKDIQLFKDAIAESGIQKPCSHDSYLINLASPKPDLWEKSVDAFVIELQRAEALGLVGVVMHPGSFVSSSEEEGLDKIVEGLDRTLDETADLSVEIWLETTAGQGTNLGHRFEQLQFLIENVQDATRVGVCVDTCHIFAAGYPLQKKSEYKKTFDEFDQTIGIGRIRAFHLNDSKRELGSRVDRHEHIGHGCLGEKPFQHLMKDKRFSEIPMYMETPKGLNDDGVEWDTINVELLRSFI